MRDNTILLLLQTCKYKIENFNLINTVVEVFILMKHKLIATGILAGAILSYSSNILADTHKFPDVPTWADKSVNYLVDKQVLNGYPDGTFGSNDSLDRASATKIMTKVLGIQIDPNAKPSFTDSQNHWATPYILPLKKLVLLKVKVMESLIHPEK